MANTSKNKKVKRQKPELDLDLDEGLNLQIGGEVGRHNTIPIDMLIKMAEDLQDLVNAVVAYDLPQDELVPKSNFKIELSDFNQGSAIPQFKFSPRSESKIGDWEKNRKYVNNRVVKLFELANTGDYSKLKTLYPIPSQRNPITTNLYNFVHGFGSTPVTIVKFDKKKKPIPVIKIKQFKTALKDEIIVQEVKRKSIGRTTVEAVANIEVTTVNGKERLHVPDNKYYLATKYSLEYAPEVINANGKSYHLNYALRCKMSEEEDYFIIQNDQLNIIGTGLKEDEAEVSFSEEFDYIYTKLMTTPDKNLTIKNRLIKSILKDVVEKII
jgi:hypothetical protein